MDGKVIIETSLDTKSFEAQISKVEDELDTLEKEYEALKKVEPYDSDLLADYRNDIEKTSNKLLDLQKKQLALQKTPTIDSGIGNVISENVKKMGKWVLAIFSVRSAYNAVRGAVSILSGQNETLANKINFIQTSLSNVLAPIVNWLVNQAYKLVYYIGYILKAWFGIDILAKKTSKSMKNSSKSAKEMRKTLAGFDEMNILQDNVKVGGVGDTLKGLDKVKIPNWVEWIADNKDKILNTIKRIGLELLGIFVTSKIIKYAIEISKLYTKFKALSTTLGGITKLKAGLVGTAAILAIIGAIELVKIISEAHKLSDEISNLVDVTESLNKNWKKKTDAMQKDAEQGKLTTKQEQDYANALLSTIKNNNVINEGIEKQSKSKQILTGTYKENNKILSLNTEEILDNLDKLKRLYDLDKLSTEQKNKYAQMINLGIKALEKQNEKLSKNSDEYKKNEDKIKNLRKEFETITGSTYVAKLDVDADTKKADSKVGNFLKKMGSGLFSTIFPNLNFANTLKKFKFAKGGIINMPGKGVPITQAIGGERGQEGIIPLTDSQQMQLLGEAIGKYVTINANIINQMNGRVISREIKKINADNDFASNV